jgi:hypothetical protein
MNLDEPASPLVFGSAVGFRVSKGLHQSMGRSFVDAPTANH